MTTEPDFLAVARGYAVRKGPECTVGLTLRQLDSDRPELAARIREALLLDVLTHAAIAKAFREFGFPIGEGTIARHRRGDCTNCPA